MKAHERFKAIIKGSRADRLPAVEWAPWWNLTVDRWNKEGLNIDYNGVKSILQIQRHFGLDGCIQTYFAVRSAQTPKSKVYGNGIIKSAAEYEKIKSTMYPQPSEFYGKEYFNWLKSTRDNDGDTIHFFTVEGFFWMPRELLGIEDHLYSFYDNGELLETLCNDYAKWLKKLFEYIGNTFKFDFMSFAEDMSYNNGPMVSKDTFDTFLLPYYKKVIPVLKELYIPVFIDSDGDITKAVDWYAEAGADGMFPLERQAGVDVSLYIKKQPHMTFLGHFDKMCLKFGEEAIIKEFERLLPSLKSGKVIPSIDHQTPPDVSIQNYGTYVKLLKQYAKKAAE